MLPLSLLFSPKSLLKLPNFIGPIYYMVHDSIHLAFVVGPSKSQLSLLWPVTFPPWLAWMQVAKSHLLALIAARLPVAVTVVVVVETCCTEGKLKLSFVRLWSVLWNGMEQNRTQEKRIVEIDK